jgi:deoxyribodipyrimidine photo-lyase
MISPVYINNECHRRSKANESRGAFLEELIVRRELSMNFCYYNDKYDSYDGLPNWAIQTLDAHAADKRPYLYSQQQLEGALTHDDYWNAA